MVMLFGVLASGFIFISCTDEPTQPSDEKIRTISFDVKIKDINGDCSEPAINAKLKIYKISTPSDVLVGSVSTDASGLAKLELLSPAVGFYCYVTGEYNGRFFQTENFLFCQDTLTRFCFERTPPPKLCCEDIQDNTINVIFTDEYGKSILYKDYPIGVRKYIKTIDVISNGCLDTNLTITIPNITDPFKLEDIVVDGKKLGTANKTITLKPNETLSLIVSVSTANTGTFNLRPSLIIDCNTNRKNWILNLNATVTEIKCDCPLRKDTILTIKEPNTVPIGQSETYNYTLFTNKAECDLRLVSILRIKNNSEIDHKSVQSDWTVVDPANYNIIISQNNQFNVRMRFEPRQTKERLDTFKFVFYLSSVNDTCKFTVIFNGKGCVDACPSIDGKPFTNRPIPANQVDAEISVAFSPDDMCQSSVLSINYGRKNFVFTYPSDACVLPSITIEATYTGDDEYSRKQFYVPSRFNVDTTRPYTYTLEFEAPTISEFKKMFTDAGGNRVKNPSNPKADSTFTILLTFRTQDGKCWQDRKSVV